MPFCIRRPADFELRDQYCALPLAGESPYAENNLVHAQWFRQRTASEPFGAASALELAGRRAQCVVRGLSRLGISALRISLPYTISDAPSCSAPTWRFREYLPHD